MLIYDDFVFMHTPKTAGYFVKEALIAELAAPSEQLKGHAGWDSIPAAAVGRPVLMYVRNPWDWYVSWYHWMIGINLSRKSNAEVQENQWLRLLFGEDLKIADDGPHGVNDFATMVRSACENLDPRHPLMAEMIANGDRHAEAVADGDDFYTANVKKVAGAGLGTDLLTIGRYESLFDDLAEFFTQNEIAVDDGLVPRMEARQPVNASPHRHYREYYDDELRDLVGRSCRELIEGFDYAF